MSRSGHHDWDITIGISRLGYHNWDITIGDRHLAK